MNASVDVKNITSDILANLNVNSELRIQAKEAFASMGLPAPKHEEYKFAPITRVLEKNFDFAVQPQDTTSLKDIHQFSIPGFDGDTLVFINGQFAESLSSFNSSDLHIKPISEDSYPEQLGTLADYKKDALVAWSTAGWTHGVWIEVAANKQIDKPVIIHHINDTNNGQVISLNRIFISIGENSQLTVLEKYNSIGDAPNFSTIVTEAFVHENGELNFISLQADKGNRFHFGQTTIKQANNSRLNCFTLTLDGKFIRDNLEVILDGEGCESHLLGLYLLQGDTLADNHTVVDHRKPNSYSNELYKGVIDGNAKGVFNGKIFVRPHAQKTNAFQSNRNILLSDKATVNTKPQLEIWADDVKCSHGCTTGQLDEEALFYLQTRGIIKDTARAMVLYAFAGEVLESIKSGVLKNYFDDLISERLHKNF
jgi:Fe-S cluster assembly protein SufD